MHERGQEREQSGTEMNAGHNEGKRGGLRDGERGQRTEGTGRDARQ